MSDRCPACGSAYITWSPQKLIEACQLWAERHGGTPPAVDDWVRSTPEFPARNAAYRQFGSWNAFIVAAGFTPRKVGGNRRWTRTAAVKTLTPWVFEHGRIPKLKEWRSPADGRPTAQQVQALFGSWNAFIVACGYEPARAHQSTEAYRRQLSGVRMREMNEAV